jgi:hypothetical protein
VAHALGQISLWCLEDQVVVITHETVGIAHTRQPPTHGVENVEEQLSITIVTINIGASIAS